MSINHLWDVRHVPNPATYTGVFSDIRNLFVGLPEAKIRGYKAGTFLL